MIDAEVQELLKKGAIQEVSPSDQAFYNGLFLVPKKEGTYRPVIDLSSLNRFVPHVHFQIEALHCLKTLLRKGDYMTSIDLEDTFFHSNSQILSKVSPFHLGHTTRHLSGSPFRSQFSTPNIHQAPETCSRLPEEAGVSHNNLFRRRPSSSCLFQRGCIASNSNVVKSITVSGLSHKLDEINTVPRSVSNIPRFCHKLCEYDHFLTRGQSSKGLCSLQQRSLSTSNVRTTACQPPRNPGVLSACHMGSPLAPKGSSNPVHTNPEEPPVRLQLSSISQSQVSSRANLVAKQFTQGQQQPCFSPTTGSHNSLRCFNARLGCHVSGQVH